MSEADWGWFAGILDGEGCITVLSRSHPRLGAFLPVIIVANSSLELMEKVRAISCRVDLTISKKSSPSGYYSIRFQKLADIKRILEHTLPHLTAKRPAAELMLKLVESRLKHQPSSYTDEEIELVKKIRELGKGPKHIHKLVNRPRRYITRRYWTVEEENFLRENKGKMSISEMAEILKRPYSSVHRKLGRI